MPGRARIVTVIALLAGAVAASGCASRWQAQFRAPRQYTELGREAPFLKVHLWTGDVYVLERWAVAAAAGEVRGEGLHYDRNRALVGEGRVTLRLDDVALLETNQLRRVTRPGIAGGIAAGVIGIPFLICVSGACR